MDIDTIHAIALREHAADQNAQRSFRVATIGDLRTWLAPVPSGHPILDTWTVQRRVDLMRRALAVKLANLCLKPEHNQAGGTAAHIAEHLAELRR